jgi:hypothetical protein
MAWTDQCKISAVQTIDKVVENMGVSVKKAIAEVSKDVDIPSATLQKWYYPRAKSEAKNGPTKEKSQKAHWRAVERKLSFIVDYMMENCQCNSGNVTRELANKINNRIGYLKTIESHYLEEIENGEGK